MLEPALRAVSVRWFVWPGTMSTLPSSAGSQKLWMTSSDVSVTSTFRPTGIRNSLAVTTPASG